MEKLTTREAAAHVLRGRRRGMTVPEIAELAIPLTSLAGRARSVRW